MKKLENLNILHRVCKSEISQLRHKVKNFEVTADELYDIFSKTWSDKYEDCVNNGYAHYKDTAIAMVEYDQVCNKLSNITKMLRKVNLQIDQTSTDSSHNCDHNMNIDLDSSLRFNLDPSQPQGLETLEGSTTVDREYLKPDLREYEEGQSIKATLTYIKNEELLSFFICDLSGPFVNEIADLGRSKHMKQYARMPQRNEVFGLVLDDVVYRAIRTDTDVNTPKYTVLLLDIGEVVHINNENIMYHLSEDFKRFSPQAIPCKLSREENLSQNEMKTFLESFLYQRVDLVVTRNDGSFLHVKMSSYNNVQSIEMKISDTNPFKSEMIAEAKKKMKAIEPEAQPPQEEEEKSPYQKLTEEELEMLYEEPVGTTNAMKAVYGYDPKDEQRICRFYNPKIKSCFKGTNCRQEHSLLDEDGWTKDTKLASTVFYAMDPGICYKEGTIIDITPTYIGAIDRFYCHINDPNAPLHTLIWTPDEISDLNKLHTPPVEFDVVLAEYIDGLWYRAEIVEIDDSGKMFKVFFIDYGNQYIVHISKLARCGNDNLRWPRQAVFCRVDGVRVIPGSVQKYTQPIALLCKTILNKDLKAKVVSHYEDLVVSIMDEEYERLKQQFIENGILKPIKTFA